MIDYVRFDDYDTNDYIPEHQRAAHKTFYHYVTCSDEKLAGYALGEQVCAVGKSQ
jgi:hypothetical protein